MFPLGNPLFNVIWHESGCNRMSFLCKSNRMMPIERLTLLY
jgi:hypothetical protein